MVDEDDVGAWCLKLLLEDVGVLALCHLEVGWLGLFLAFECGQGTEVLGQEGCDGVYVEVANEEELEVVGIGKALFVNLEYAVIVDAVEVFWLCSAGSGVVVVYDFG